MALNINGAGYICQRKDGLLYPIFASVFNFAEELETQESEGYPVNDVGLLQKTDLVAIRSTITVTVATQSLDEMDFSRMVIDQDWGTIASMVIPVLSSGKVPDSPGPYTISVAGLVEDQEVEITTLSDTAPGKVALTQIAASGTPAANQYKVTADTITFHSGLAGKQVVFYYKKTQTSFNALGGTLTSSYLGEVEILGKIRTTRSNVMNIWFPRCQSLSGVNMEITADAAQREYRATIPTELGFTRPYLIWT